jgi:hypothetical protein
MYVITRYDRETDQDVELARYETFAEAFRATLRMDGHVTIRQITA